MKLAATGLLAAILALAPRSSGQEGGSISRQAPWSVRIADSFLLRHPSGLISDTGFQSSKWTYEQGLMLEALFQMWRASGERKYLAFIEKNLSQYVDSSGGIRTYKPEDFNLDNVAAGKALLRMYESEKSEKWKLAAERIRLQLKGQPRTAEGGFWHKAIYPHQMWLDGLYMAEPFYGMYARIYREPDDFDDIASQFILMARHARDTSTGLLYHGWDESRRERWADSATGCSPNFWGRSIGWYMMGLVDVLDEIPREHPRRGELVRILKDLSAAMLKFRDEKTRVWYQVVDQGSKKGNYLESSSSCMVVYCFAKGALKGHLGKEFADAARESFQAVLEHFVSCDSNGFVDLHGTCRGAGLGGKPYRDGSFEYYTGEPQRTNDPKGVGALLLAAVQVEQCLKGQPGDGHMEKE